MDPACVPVQSTRSPELLTWAASQSPTPCPRGLPHWWICSWAEMNLVFSGSPARPLPFISTCSPALGTPARVEAACTHRGGKTGLERIGHPRTASFRGNKIVFLGTWGGVGPHGRLLVLLAGPHSLEWISGSAFYQAPCPRQLGAGGTACSARNWPSACFDFAPAPGGLGRRTVSTGRSPGSRSGAGRGGLGVDTLRQTAPLTWQRGKGGALGAYPESSLDGVGAAVIR